MVLFACIIMSGLLLHFTPLEKRRAIFPYVIAISMFGAAYTIYEAAAKSVDFISGWIIVPFAAVWLLSGLIFVIRTTYICESCGHIGSGIRKGEISRCARCGATDAEVNENEEAQRLTPPPPPPLPDMPDGFTVETSGSTCAIQHVLTGMKAMKVFLCVFLVFWTIAFAWVINQYSVGGVDKRGNEITLWHVSFFIASWLLVAVFSAYSFFGRKTFKLGDEYLEVETELFKYKRLLVLPRYAITKVRQIKDSVEGKNSFPSWGLEIECLDQKASLLKRIAFFNSPQHLRRYRVLAKQPYEQSAWLGNMIARWCDAELTLCPDPEQES